MICALVALHRRRAGLGLALSRQPHLAVTIAVGLFAGVLGGAVQISGPPIVIYWLGSMHDVGIVRASLISYFGLFSAGSVVTYYFHGLLTATLRRARDPARPAAYRRDVGGRQDVSSCDRRKPTGAWLMW